MIEIKEARLTITSPGDPSVGLWSARWTISGPLEFENAEDREEFRVSILQSFGILAEDAYAEFGSEEMPDMPPEWDGDYRDEGLDYDVG
jgi:hypothetical protein